MLETAVTVQADQTIPRQLGSAHRRPRPPRPWRARRRARRRWCKSRCYTAASPPACSRRRRRCCSRSRSLLSWTPARAARRPCHSLADRHRRHRHVLHPHQPYPRPTQMSFRSAAKEPQEHEAHGARSAHPEYKAHADGHASTGGCASLHACHTQNCAAATVVPLQARVHSAGGGQRGESAARRTLSSEPSPTRLCSMSQLCTMDGGRTGAALTMPFSTS